jgi:hypothetical protein
MQFAISIPQFVADGTFDAAGFRAHLARAEALGFESAWTGEQVLGTMPHLGPIETMTYAAACTERLRIGCMMPVSPLYSPVHLADAHGPGTPLPGGPPGGAGATPSGGPGGRRAMIAPMIDRALRLRKRVPSVMLVAAAASALAVGAVAIGALAVGAMSVGRLRIRDARIERLVVHDLTVARLHRSDDEPEG